MDEFNNTIWICPHPKVKSNAFSLYCFYDLKRDLVVFCDSREVGQVSDVLVLFNQMGLPRDRFNGF